MEKLGYTNSTLVKTTTHVHPVMNNLSMGAGPPSDLMKKATTSPASTLSDKGIGSSVGSFDSEYRQESSISYTTKLTYDQSKTGSLDSRTQEVNEKSIPVHTRSSSDIICQSKASDIINRPMLAEQSNTPLWNGDPRRLSVIGADATITSSIKPKKIRPKLKSDSRPAEKVLESDVRKLPQLYRDSTVQPATSCPQNSNHAISNVQIGSNGKHSNIISSSGLPTSLADVSLHQNYNYSSWVDDVAPPLPPKAAHLRTPGKSTNASCFQTSKVVPERFHPYPDSNQTVANPQLIDSSYLPGAPTPSQLATPLHQSGCAVQSFQNTYPDEVQSMWSRDLRRKASLPVEPTQLSFASMGTGFAKAESLAGLPTSDGRQQCVMFHGSANVLPNNEHPFNSSYASSDHSSVHSDDLFKRQATARSSTRSNPGDRRKPSYNEHQVKTPGAALRIANFVLEPLHFELPYAISTETKFIGREWLFKKISNIFANEDSKTNKVAIIIGEKASGKTAIIEHLASFSYQGRNSSKRTELDTLTRGPPSLYRSSSPLNRSFLLQHHMGHSNHSSRNASPAPSFGSGESYRTGDQIGPTEDSFRKVASQVVAFHFCQSDNNTMCYLPEFLYSIAAQMSQAPQLTLYRELLVTDPNVRALLTMQNCIQNPSQVLNKAILEPLKMLSQNQKFPKSNMIILIDAINEAEQYLSEYGYSIQSFLKEHLLNFPDFLKIVITCRTGSRNLVADLPGTYISLDDKSENVSRDMQLYIAHRISISKTLANLTLSGKPDTALAHKQLSQHLIKTAEGNFLYLRMILDLIDNGSLIPKSAGFTTFPRNLHEVFLLLCNLKFHSYTSFDDVRDVISVALASLYPLRDDLLHKAVVSQLPPNTMSFPVFKDQMKILDSLLVQSPTSGKRSFFHPIFKEWLMGQLLPVKGNGTLQSSNRFKVDVKRGNFLLATFLSSLPPETLSKHSTLELAHHVLKASSLFKAQLKQEGSSSSDFNANFLAAHSKQVTAALLSVRNLLYPNMKICKLLLKAGANPNCNTEIFCNAPPLAVAAHTGCLELAQLLLMFNADVDHPARNGMTALAFASAAGHLEMVNLLLKYRPILNNFDQNGHTPLLHALARNHSTVAKILLSPEFYVTSQHLAIAAQQALVAAATTGNIEFIEYLFTNRNYQCNVNDLEMLHGETPLTSAAARGNVAVCEYLIKQCRADIHLRNKAGLTPLLCAVKHGEFAIVDTLLNFGAAIETCDVSGKTPLMCAAAGGHLSLLEVLMCRGANVDAVDKDNMTALSWAVYKGHAHCVRSLIGRSDIHHCNVNGRNALHLAAMSGDPQIIDTLLHASADICSSDVAGFTALDCAIEKDNEAMVTRLLTLGSPIQDISWKIANGNLEIIKALLSFSHEQAMDAYKLMDYHLSQDICVRALHHMDELLSEDYDPPQHSPDIAELCAHVLLAYSKCLRKLDSLKDAHKAVTRALELKPHWYEASYVRARVLRDQSRLESALLDVIDAERHAPTHYLKEVRHLIDKIKEEIRSSDSKSQRSSVSSEITIPRTRPRLHSASSCHGNPSRARSPSPPTAGLSRSYRSGSLCPPPPLQNDAPHMIRVNSQDSLVASVAGMSLPPNNVVPYPASSVRRTPLANAHWRPQVAELNRSLSTGSHLARFYRSKTPRPYEHNNYLQYSGRVGATGDGSRGALVTDL